MDEVQDDCRDAGGRQRQEHVVEAQVPRMQGYIRAAVLVLRKAWMLRAACGSGAAAGAGIEIQSSWFIN